MRQATARTDTLWWLHEQLGELDRWRAELMQFPENRCPSSLERLDAHREWLERQLAELEDKSR